ncbi:MAG: mechanosensitive ion channel [Gemmatimonadota bacterium]|jgi:small-conductance mechanosensitive channel
MNISSLVDSIRDFLATPLIQLGSWIVALQDLLLASVLLSGSWVVARAARRLASRVFAAESEEEQGGSVIVETVTWWAFMLAGVVLALDAVGLDMAVARDVLNAQLFSIGGDSPVTLVTLFFAAVVVGLTWVLSRILRRGLERAFRVRQVDEGTTAITKRLVHYVVMAVGVALALQNLGVNLGALFAAGAVFAVGIGFAMQNIAQNFVSGLILLVERTIKPGDVLEVDGMVVVVEKMGIRATVARTRDEEEIIIPNSTLVQTSVKNYTLRDSLYRLRALVGVEYGSDMAQVMSVLQEAANGVEWRFGGRDPVVLLRAFADSSVNFEVSVWMQDPWTAPRAHSKLNQAVWDALGEAGITIAFPQIDVHFDPPIDEAAGRFPRAS